MRVWAILILAVLAAALAAGQDMAINPSTANFESAGAYQEALVAELESRAAGIQGELTSATARLRDGDAKAREAARIVAAWRRERRAVEEQISALEGRLRMIDTAREVLCGDTGTTVMLGQE